MRSRIPLFAALVAVSLTVAGTEAAYAQNTPPTGYTAGYFVLDFNSGVTPEYNFQYNFLNGQNPTATTVIESLAAATITPKFTESHTDYGGTLGYFYTAFGYGSQSAANTPNFDYTWSLFTSSNGTNWTLASNGASSTNLMAATPYVAFSYGPSGFTSSGSPISPLAAPPAVLTITGSAAPEPGTVALVATGFLGGLAPIVRCRRRP
jgi:hypothetical protein